MIQDDNYVEFDLKSILFYILRGWKLNFLAACVAALALGGLKAATAGSISDYEKNYQTYQEDLSVYDNDLVRIQDEIDTLQQVLCGQRDVGHIGDLL